MRCWFFHEWGPWERAGKRTSRWTSLGSPFTREHEEQIIERECARCGLVQRKYI